MDSFLQRFFDDRVARWHAPNRPTMNDHDVFILARTIYGEARGEDEYGKRLVGFVILNRYRTSYRGKDTIARVCQDKWQFSCWNENDPNRAKLLAIDLGDRVFRDCFRAALEAIDGTTELPTNTRHYYATSMPKPPFWADGKQPILEHGRHKFYAGIA